MASRLIWRRSATAIGIYGAAALGFLGTVVASRELGRSDFGRLAIVIAAIGFLQLLLDLTVEEAAVKYCFRYSTAGDWGRFRRVFQISAVVVLAGGLLGAAALLVLAPFSHAVFRTSGLTVPLLVAALVPVLQAPEGLAETALILRQRYDVRALFLALSMGLRLAGLAVGARHGVLAAVLGIVAAQVVASAAVTTAGIVSFRRFPAAPATPLGDDRVPFRRFVVQSSIGTTIVTFKSSLPTLLVALVASPLQVGFFKIAQAPQSAFASLSAPARLILLAEQTRDFEQGRIARLFQLLRRYMLATGLGACAVVPLLWWLMPTLVRLVYGARWVPAVEAARLIVVAAALQVVLGWTKSFPVSIGRPILRVIAQSIEIAVLVPVLLALGAVWGATGAAGGVLAASVAFAAVWVVLLVRLRRSPLGPPAAAGGPRPVPVEPELLAP